MINCNLKVRCNLKYFEIAVKSQDLVAVTCDRCLILHCCCRVNEILGSILISEESMDG